MNDEIFMRAALREAHRGLGHTSPNPAVGAVIVRGARVVARGFHRQAGLPHAEIEALSALARRQAAHGATLFVTLEPCSTQGRTPPCVEAIIRAGFRRVVIGSIDPNPQHAGRGIDLLRAAGLTVDHGVLEAECRELNAAFNKWIITKLPFVIAKAGMSLDGRLTRPPGEGQWLTGESARTEVHQLRAHVDAIMIGAGTLRADNPRLTVRGIRGARQPWRVVVADRRPLPRTAHVFTDTHHDRTLVYRAQSLRTVLRDLGRRQITSVLIEGGMRLLGEAFDRRLVDRVRFYIAPVLCGGPVVVIGGRGTDSTATSLSLKNTRYRRLGEDLVLEAEV